MTNFKDSKGLQSVKAIKLSGADSYMGTSASISAFTSTAGDAVTRSVSSYSVNGTVFDCTETDAATIAAEVALIWKTLSDLGILDVYYDGTNQV